MSIANLNLVTLQSQLAARLKAFSYFDDVPVLHDAKGDVAALTAKAVTQLGLGITISTPRFNLKNPNVPAPFFDPILVDATVWELVEVNRTAGSKKPALTVAQYALQALLLYRPDSCNVLTVLDPAIEEVGVEDPPGISAYVIHLRTSGGYSATLTDSTVGDNTLDLLGLQSTSTPT